jgi:type I restriction enzyme S subunit
MINENELPQNWELVNSSDILDIRDGTHDTPKYVENNGIPLITSKNLKGNKIDFQKVSYISQEDHIEVSKRSKVEEGDILFAMIGTIGNPVVVRKSQEFSIKNVGLFKKNEEKILPEFLVNFLRSRTFEKQLSERKLLKGTTQKFIPLGNLRNIYLPLPPLAEQERIVAKIEELFSELYAGLESLKTAQAQLKIYRQAVLKYAFEGKLTNDNVKEGKLPNGWKWKTVGDICSNVEYGSATKSQPSGKIPVLTMGNIQNGRFDWEDLVFTSDDIEIKKYLLKKNDVLFNRTNSAELVGKTAIYKGERPAIFAGYLIRINRIESLVDANYLTYFLNSHDAKSYGNTVKSFGVNQSNINGTKLKTYPIPVPTIEEQQRIVEEIESRLSVCDKLEETINASLKQADALRQSILKQAFEGKLVKPKEIEKPKRTPFYQMQTLGLIVDRSKQRNIRHGEMTLAKYAFLADKIYGVPIYENYQRWHLGPYPTEIKKTVNNREYFKIENNTIRVLNEEKLFKYHNDYQEQIETAVDELAEIFLTFEPKDRSHKIELLATVCKVIEDIQTAEIEAVRQSMMEWKIDLKDKRFNNKAEKFGEEETTKCVEFIKQKGWDKKLFQ